jgi:hypothetical protein
VPKLAMNEAATALGIHPDTLRRRIKRGQIAAERDAEGRYVIDVPDADADVGSAEAAPRQAPDRAEALPRHLQMQLDGLKEEVAWLRARLEAAEAERGELRRMLNLEQQTVAAAQQAALLAAPAPLMPREAPARPDTVTAAVAPMQTPAAVEQALKRVGVKGKKVRRRVVEAFVVLFRR